VLRQKEKNTFKFSNNKAKQTLLSSVSHVLHRKDEKRKSIPSWIFVDQSINGEQV